MMKVQVIAKALTAPAGNFVRGSVLEMSDADAAVSIREGVVVPAPDDAELSTPIPHDAQHVDELIAASQAQQFRERAESIAFLKGHRDVVRAALSLLHERRELVHDATVCLGVLGLQ